MLPALLACTGLVGVPFCPIRSKYPISEDSGAKTIRGMVFGTRSLKCYVLGPSGCSSQGRAAESVAAPHVVLRGSAAHLPVPRDDRHHAGLARGRCSHEARPLTLKPSNTMMCSSYLRIRFDTPLPCQVNGHPLKQAEP